MNRKDKIREVMLHSLVEVLKLPYVKVMHRKRKPWDLDSKELSTFEKGTIGHELYVFLSRHKLNLQPLYESHDVYHIISGIGIGLINEARLFLFLIGNGKRSLSVIGSGVVALLCYPDRLGEFKQAFLKGKQFKPIYNINYEDKLTMNYHDFLDAMKKC